MNEWPVDGTNCFLRLAERIALLYGATDEQAKDLAKRHMDRFGGQDPTVDLAEVGESDSSRVVDCDDNCGALLDPITPAQIQAALEHWRWHGQLGGCSHAR